MFRFKDAKLIVSHIQSQNALTEFVGSCNLHSYSNAYIIIQHNDDLITDMRFASTPSSFILCLHGLVFIFWLIIAM